MVSTQVLPFAHMARVQIKLEYIANSQSKKKFSSKRKSNYG